MNRIPVDSSASEEYAARTLTLPDANIGYYSGALLAAQI